MAEFVSASAADGRYKIFNVQSPQYFVHLYYGAPSGTICIYRNDSTDRQQWRLKNLGNHQVIFENIRASRTFASVYSENFGAGLAGSTNSSIWTLRAVPNTENKYYITTADGTLAWGAGLIADGAPISLYNFNEVGEYGQWSFTPV